MNCNMRRRLVLCTWIIGVTAGMFGSYARSLPVGSAKLSGASRHVLMAKGFRLRPEQSTTAQPSTEPLEQANYLDNQADEAAQKAVTLEQKARSMGSIFGAPLMARAKHWREKESEYRQEAAKLRAHSSEVGQSNASPHGDTETGLSGTPPAGLPQILDHQWCSIKYPSDWRAYTSSMSAVVLSPEPQATDYTRMNTVPPHYGVIIKAAHLGPLVNDLSEANFQELLLYLKSQHDGWGEPLSYSTAMSLNGRPARAAEIARSYFDHGQQVRQRGWVVAIQPPGAGLGRGNFFIFYAVFLAPEDEFQSDKPLFEKIASTIIVKEIGAPSRNR
jgi:hypothetical protein